MLREMFDLAAQKVLAADETIAQLQEELAKV